MGFIAGKSNTSLISVIHQQSASNFIKCMSDALVEFVKNMTRRSIPNPHPPVGGRPCSRLVEISQLGFQDPERNGLRVNKSFINTLCFIVTLFLLLDLQARTTSARLKKSCQRTCLPALRNEGVVRKDRLTLYRRYKILCRT